MLISSLIYSLLSTVIRVLINVGMVSVYSHSLSLSVFSYFALGLFISQIICIITDAGVNVEIMRFSRLEQNEISLKRLADSTLVRLTLGIISTLLFVIYYFVYKSDHSLSDVMMMSSSMMSGIIASIIETYLINIKAKNKFGNEICIVLIQSILLLAFSLSSFIGEWVAILSLIIPRFLVLYWLSVKNSKYFLYRSKLSVNLIFKYFSRLKYYSIDSILSNMSAQLDNCLIVILLGREVYGLYQPVSRLNNSAQGLAAAIGSFAIPLASTYQQLIKKWLILQCAFIIFGFICAAGMYIFSGYIITHMFGPGFISNNNIIFILSLILFVRYVAAGSGSFLTLIGQQRLRALINVVFTICGGCIGYMFGHTIVNILQIVLCSQIVLLLSYFAFGLLKLNSNYISIINTENS